MSEMSKLFKQLQEVPQEGAQHVLHLLEAYLMPFLLVLDRVLDTRLVRTLLQCLVTLIRLRNSPQALWLSELGASLQGYEGYSQSAPAGTKRVGKLLRSLKWNVGFIDRFLLEQADQQVQRLRAQGQRILCLWDGSVLEKAESADLEGLCPVLSSKAKRRQRSRPGLLFNWPAPRPIRVMGMQWSAALIAGMQGVPQLAITRWWSTKGEDASRLRELEEELLRISVRRWGPLLLHVFDRGYASGPWLSVLATYRTRFVIRWIHRHLFLTLDGVEKKLWQIGQGKKYLAHQEICDPSTGERMPCDLWWSPLRHQASQQPLWLVKARIKKGVMYLVTNEPVKTAADAWEVFFAYRRRWRIEEFFRFNKCELVLESPRLWSLPARLKLLGMVMLVYGFLISLLDPQHRDLVEALLRFKCHRTGRRCQQVQTPLYRLRWALSRLWDDHRPRFSYFLPPADGPCSVASLLSFNLRVSQNWG
jgi:hypothetical protein